MTTNHIDQLREWWESAEKGAPSKGDAIIRRTERLLSNGYAYEVGTEDYTDAKHLDNVRILARAPKPKPAWHGAVAVMARCSNAPEGRREPFIRSEATPDVWIGEGGCGHTDDLRDVTPLIEAKVTDEMRDRVRDYCRTEHQVELPRDDVWLNELLTAALGLELA